MNTNTQPTAEQVLELMLKNGLQLVLDCDGKPRSIWLGGKLLTAECKDGRSRDKTFPATASGLIDALCFAGLRLEGGGE